MTDRIKQTRAAYDEVAAEYSSRIYGELTGKPLDRALLDVFAESVAPGSRVCDAGCGPGHVARYLRDRGVNVFGVDLSPGMVAEASRLNPDIEFRAGDFCELDTTASLAGIVAFYSLIHLDRDRVNSALAKLSEALKPNGMLFIAFHIGEGELHRDEWWGHTVSVDFAFFGVDEMRGYLLEAGFTLEWVVEREPYADVEHPSRRAYILARRSQPQIHTDKTDKTG